MVRPMPIQTPSPTPAPGLLGGLLGGLVSDVTSLTCGLPLLGSVTCTAVERVVPALGVGATPAQIPGYHPADIQAAYSLPVAAGTGQTIAIVVPYDDPNAESDLAVYRSTFGLSACTTANGCFKKSVPLLNQSQVAWGKEMSIDLDMASAACPNCKLLVVESGSDSTTALAAAVSTAIRLGATVVSNSYATPEDSSAILEDALWNHPGVPIVAGAGDSGYGVMWPASSQYVTAVGGTTLTRDGSARGFSESIWSGTGSGCSQYMSKPSWQNDSGCANRSVADVAAIADPNPGVAVFDTYGAGGWLVFGGTSVATPIVAGGYALAGNGGSINDASHIYANTGALNDVTSGSNGSCGSYLCNGAAGYDGPSGLGSPKGTAAF
jgi:subtilase family serine protease